MASKGNSIDESAAASSSMAASSAESFIKSNDLGEFRPDSSGDCRLSLSSAHPLLTGVGGLLVSITVLVCGSCRHLLCSIKKS